MRPFVSFSLLAFLFFPLSLFSSSGGKNLSLLRPEVVPGSSVVVGRGDSLRPGDAAPTFVMRDVMTGEPVYLRDYTGTTLREEGKKNKERHVVVLSFWATWCQPCKQEIPHLMKISLDFKGKPVKFFLVDAQEQATEDSVKTVLASRGYTLQCLVDASGRFADKYTVHSLPVLVVIDKFGIVRMVNRGYREDMDASIVKLLNSLVVQ